jgi:hypothetical protein
MKEFNKNGVFCLTANTPEGYVKVLRVGDVDYIWTEGGASVSIYIILIPDLLRGFRIPVTLKKGDYTFTAIELLDGTEDMVRYQYDTNMTMLDGIGVSFEYMPYIHKTLGRSHVSVGAAGSLFYPDPVNDWHYKYYVLDCTGDQSTSEHIWRPPAQTATVAFGEDLLPPWYSMSPLTAHNFHWCFEAAIDQSKRIYQPVNTDIVLASEEVATPAGFILVSKVATRYNFIYPVQVSRFYGKNAFQSDGEKMVTWGGSIYVSGLGESTIPVDVDPILFFWPWIPYLDEIRSFNILYYSGKTDPISHAFEGFYMYPSLDTFKKYGIGHYNEGIYAVEELAEENATFSEVTVSRNTNNTSVPSDCGCGDCGTGNWTEVTTSEIPPYNSSGKKYIPIGLIGLTPIAMETTWLQSGSGPVVSNSVISAVTGTYPWDSLHSGSYFGLDHYYESCCRAAFKNTKTIGTAYGETASNSINIRQTLKVGDDVIFSGESSMNYSMSYQLQEQYNGSIEGTVAPVGEELPVCAGHINYTSQQMSVSQTQNLSWTDDTVYPSYAPCEGQWQGFVFTWSLSGGGSLSSTTDQNIVYTAPSSNAGCTQNATISLLCNGVAVDTLEIAINAVATGVAFYIKATAFDESTPSYEEPCLLSGYYAAWRISIDAYKCDGTLNNHVGGSTQYSSYPCWSLKDDDWVSPSCCVEAKTKCENGVAPVGPLDVPIDTRTAAQIAAGCCPAELL